MNSLKMNQLSGALVQWLKEETHNPKVVSSNLCIRYQTDIFHIIFVVNFVLFFVFFVFYIVCLEKTKNKRKRSRGSSIFKKCTSYKKENLKVKYQLGLSSHKMESDEVYAVDQNWRLWNTKVCCNLQWKLSLV